METERLREIDIQLAEYQALRAEMVYYIQRIDQTVTFYVTAMFGILGGWPTRSPIPTPEGAPPLSRFLRQGGDFDFLSSSRRTLLSAIFHHK